MGTDEPQRAFATLIHARLRADQGDVAGAARILRVILQAQPEHGEARAFLESLEDRVTVTYRDPRPSSARRRAILRVRAYLDAIRRGRGERRV